MFSNSVRVESCCVKLLCLKAAMWQILVKVMNDHFSISDQAGFNISGPSL